MMDVDSLQNQSRAARAVFAAVFLLCLTGTAPLAVADELTLGGYTNFDEVAEEQVEEQLEEELAENVEEVGEEVAEDQVADNVTEAVQE